ncbi:hypothetical protein [Nonomuraea sp. NPDC050310]|uniref:hypothetical protein n=1 Tax=unclassified Nonomuraea TaxID=2593643 RepID=UPI0033F67951
MTRTEQEISPRKSTRAPGAPRPRVARPTGVPRPRPAGEVRRAPAPARRPVAGRKQRGPFVLLVVGLMLGGLVSLLLLNTVLARDTITRDRLKAQIAENQERTAELQREVELAKQPEELYKRGKGQGMTENQPPLWLPGGGSGQ